MDFKEFILWWNNSFPIDIVYRKKHNIRFNSKQHREVNLIDVKIELEEERLINYHQKLYKFKEEEKEYYKETGKWLRKSSEDLSQDEIQDIYDNIDLNKL